MLNIDDIIEAPRSPWRFAYTTDVIAHYGVLDEDVHFIQKPFSMKDLAVKVREMLDCGKG